MKRFNNETTTVGLDFGSAIPNDFLLGLNLNHNAITFIHETNHKNIDKSESEIGNKSKMEFKNTTTPYFRSAVIMMGVREAFSSICWNNPKSAALRCFFISAVVFGYHSLVGNYVL